MWIADVFGVAKHSGVVAQYVIRPWRRTPCGCFVCSSCRALIGLERIAQATEEKNLLGALSGSPVKGGADKT